MNVFETVIYERVGDIAYVTLNRPRVLNAFSIQMRDDLFEVLTAVGKDDEIRVLVIKGAGEKAFCGGADLSEFLTAPSAVKARRIRALRDLWGVLQRLPQPVIAVLHGYVFGSGMEIALFADIRIAAPDVVFGLPEVDLGILPGAGGTQTVPRVIGLSRALDMLLTRRRIGAQEALRTGLVGKVVAREKLLEAADEIASGIARHRPDVVRAAKQAVLHGQDMSLRDGLKLEKRLAAGAGMDRRSTMKTSAEKVSLYA